MTAATAGHLGRAQTPTEAENDALRAHLAALAERLARLEGPKGQQARGRAGPTR
jgi:hypothetical protein